MILTILTSISKIAIAAFIMTFGAIIVELYLISRKEKTHSDKKNVQIPAFNSGLFKPQQHSDEEPIKLKKAQQQTHSRGLTPKYILGVVVVCFVVFIVAVIGMAFKSKQNAEVVESPVAFSPPSPTSKPSPTKMQGGGVFDVSEPSSTPSPSPLSISPSSTPSPLPTSKNKVTPSVSLSPTQSLQPTREVEAFAQAPSPTIATYPSASISTKPTTTIAVPSPSTSTKITITLTPTKKSSPTLPVTGGYNMSFLLVITALALITFALIY